MGLETLWLRDTHELLTRQLRVHRLTFRDGAGRIEAFLVSFIGKSSTVASKQNVRYLKDHSSLF